jgi:hypothetical protein
MVKTEIVSNSNNSSSENRNNHLKEEIVSSIENLVDSCHLYKHRNRDNQPFLSHFYPKLSNISDKLVVYFSSLQLLKCWCKLTNPSLTKPNLIKCSLNLLLFDVIKHFIIAPLQ